MVYVITGVCIAVVAIALLICIKKKKHEPTEQMGLKQKAERGLKSRLDKHPDELVVRLEKLPAKAIFDNSGLVEITDSKLLARIDSLVPGLAHATGNIVQAAKARSEVLYRAVIPAGTKLADSKAVPGAVRGFYLDNNGIGGHANLVSAAKEGAVVAKNIGSAAMSVAAMVVGQYYMAQINSGLGEISDGVSKISDFQDNEFRSRVFSLIAHVKQIAEFQMDILENDALRPSKILQLDDLEAECTQLLGQANLTLSNFAAKKDIDYQTYEKEVKEAQNWYMYQNSLLDVLYRIAELRYTLNTGTISREQCTALLSLYTKQAEDANNLLAEWHRTTVKRLSIDIASARRKRAGLDSAIHFIPGLFNDEYNFKAIEGDTADMIAAQTMGRDVGHSRDVGDLYVEDVQLISKGGKIYYLPKREEE